MENEMNYTISETYRLPSGGYIYDKPVNAMVELRSMTARDELKRLNSSASPLKRLADLIEGCMIEKPAVHVYDMAMGDYEYLLHKLRTVSYGPEYKISVECPACGEIINTVVSLDDLAVKPFDRAEFDNLRTITLPVSGKVVKLNFQTPHMVDMAETKAKEMKRKAPTADIHFETYAQLLSIIDTVDEKKMSSVDLEYFINDLPVRDMNKILNASEKLNAYVGIDTTINLTCDHCGEEVTTFFRFGSEFFRPTEM